MPVQGVLSPSYGWRWSQMRSGINIAGAIGTPVQAAAGTVEFAGWTSGGDGNLIDIRHADGSMPRYAHLDRVLVQQGDCVSQGQAIGAMGSTGRSTGPHPHFEIHLVGQGAVDPIGYLAQYTRAKAVKLSVTRLHTLLSSAAFCGGSPTQNKQYSLIYTHAS